MVAHGQLLEMPAQTHVRQRLTRWRLGQLNTLLVRCAAVFYGTQALDKHREGAAVFCRVSGCFRV